MQLRYYSFLFALIAALVADAASAADRKPPAPRFSLIQSGGGLGINIEETVFIAQDEANNWFVARDGETTNWCGRHDDHGCAQTRTPFHQYIDGRTCPALGSVIEELAEVRRKDSAAAHAVVSDTPLMSLVTYRNGGTMKSQRLSEYERPLVDWWALALKRLNSCWSTTQPTRF